jgi:hypothetical protein
MLYLDVVYHAFLLFLILGVLFMAYGAGLESDLVTKKIVKLADEAISDEIRITETVRAKILRMTPPTQCTNQLNASLFFEMALTIVILFTIALVATVYASMHATTGELVAVISRNLILFTIVSVVELVFFLKVIMKYIPVSDAEFLEYFKEGMTDALAT